MKNRQKNYLIGGLAIVLTACGASSARKETPKEPAEPIFTEDEMDLTVRPGDDFFRYVNGGWLAKTEMPKDKSSYASFDIVREETDARVKGLLERLSGRTDFPEGSLEQKIGDFYATGMDMETIESQGLSVIQPELDRIAAVKTKEDLQDLVAHFHVLGMGPLFGGAVLQDFKDSKVNRFYFFQSGLGMPDRDYYLEMDERSKKLRAEYLTHLEKMFVLMGDDQTSAATAADTVMAIETQLAEKSWTKTELRNLPAMYNKMTLEDLQKRVPQIDWVRYFAKIDDSAPSEVIVGMPLFMERVGQLIDSMPIESWRIYLRWCLINRMAPFLGEELVMQDYHFFKEVMEGSEEIEPRWRRVVKTTNALMGEPVGRLYVKDYFPPSSKERMVELVEYLRAAFEKRLEANLWMTDATKAEALTKLKKMRAFIGYPDKWEDYTKLEVKRDSYAKNVLRASRFAYYKEYDKLNKPVDPDEWDLDPHEVNAGYNPLRNVVMFPAGILQPPFFYADADDAVNFGAIGMAIGHEMTHGFDDMGRNFDKDGNMRDWWTTDDMLKFRERTQLLVDQYNSFSVLGKTHVNGKLSLGENIADFGGLTIAFDAYRMAHAEDKEPPMEGFEPEQRFFMSFARVWRGLIRDEALLKYTQEDEHPWGEYRVNGAPFNVPQFYEVFGITEKDKLYRSETERPVIW